MLTDPGYKFCPKCGAPLGRRRLKEFEPERLVCTRCLYVMYLNPKVAAGAVVEHQGGIVLLRREIDPRAGFWVHPGGFVDRGETLEQAAIRETREEVGLDVEIQGLLGAFSFHDSEVVVVTYAARAISGEPTVGDESLEVRTFDPQRLPWDELAFPSTRLALKEYLRTMDARRPLTPDRAPTVEISRALVTSALRSLEDAHHSASPRVDLASEPGRLEVLLDARTAAFRAKDVRTASLVYPQLIEVLREGRRFREALEVAEEGLALTHDPLIARLADEVADELAEAEKERC
ncbi:MAG TPA: NUDIX hydrolase [Vicinamibacteria bacterium]|nr:NUDIX hydrolase [Vicinamibacteria bacterium]HRB11825.1 NUDIX hydrolase [Vicinamibacteria bacterium]